MATRVAPKSGHSRHKPAERLLLTDNRHRRDAGVFPRPAHAFPAGVGVCPVPHECRAAGPGGWPGALTSASRRYWWISSAYSVTLVTSAPQSDATSAGEWRAASTSIGDTAGRGATVSCEAARGPPRPTLTPTGHRERRYRSPPGAAQPPRQVRTDAGDPPAARQPARRRRPLTCAEVQQEVQV